MMHHRNRHRFARRDANHDLIAQALRQVGCKVIDLSHVGDGCPDLLVTGYSQRTERVDAVLVEIKTEKGKFTPAEQRFFADYGLEGPLIVARTVDDVLRWFGRLDE